MKAKNGGNRQKNTKLEVSLRKRELKEQLYDHALSIVEAKMIEGRILDKMPENEVPNEDYGNLIVFGLIGKLTESQASKFGFTTTVPRTSLATERVNDTLMVDASGLPTGQPAKNQNQNNAHQGSHKFSIDFIDMKKIDLQRLVDKFTDGYSAIMKIVKSKVQLLFMGACFWLWEEIKKQD